MDELGRNVVIFGVNMDSWPFSDNKGKNILTLGKGQTEGLGEHSLEAEKIYSINFTKINTKFCLSLHYNEANSYLFVNSTEIIKFKAKDSEIKAYSLCLENISKDWSQEKTKQTGLKGYVYNFSTDHKAADVDNIKDVHKYLMKKIALYKMFKFIKQIVVSTLKFFRSLLSVNPLECVSMNNQIE